MLELTSVCSQANTEFPYEVLCRRRSYEHREPDSLELDLDLCSMISRVGGVVYYI